jgi:hypothetical protein
MFLNSLERVLKFKQFLQLDNKRCLTLNSDVNLSEIQVHIDLKDITLSHRTYALEVENQVH